MSSPFQTIMYFLVNSITAESSHLENLWNFGTFSTRKTFQFQKLSNRDPIQLLKRSFQLDFIHCCIEILQLKNQCAFLLEYHKNSSDAFNELLPWLSAYLDIYSSKEATFVLNFVKYLWHLRFKINQSNQGKLWNNKRKAESLKVVKYFH